MNSLKLLVLLIAINVVMMSDSVEAGKKSGKSGKYRPNLPPPTYEQFRLDQIPGFYISGYQDSMINRIGAHTPNEFIAMISDPANSRYALVSDNTIFHVRANESYAILPYAGGACFRVGDYTYADLVQAFAEMRHLIDVYLYPHSNKKFKLFTGYDYDVSSACAPVANTFITDQNGIPFENPFEQFLAQLEQYVALVVSITGPLDVAVSGRCSFNYTRDPKESDWTLPTTCSEENLFDFDEFAFKMWGCCNVNSNVAIPLSLRATSQSASEPQLRARSLNDPRLVHIRAAIRAHWFKKIASRVSM
jgi:hypothetical protein